jgi:DNA-binding NarL/FixJ family response regulator
MIGRGYKPRDIAKELNLSPKTIETYRDHIKKKLNLGSASELARVAVDWVSTMNM